MRRNGASLGEVHCIFCILHVGITSHHITTSHYIALHYIMYRGYLSVWLHFFVVVVFVSWEAWGE
ncbi:hypothetical protein GE21DRAFT_1131886 [Neurospora crassa]|nr:hypothetical protein GE21DRAFT_1131886 [Neurospora crassa]